MIKIKLFTFFLLVLGFLPKKQSDKHLLNVEIKKNVEKFKGEINFGKASFYFMEKNWDSTLVYSIKQLSDTDNKTIIDFCHYFRAISFKQKKLLNEAIKEFNEISNDFLFPYKVKLSLGEILLKQNKFRDAIACFQEINRLPENSDIDFNRSAVVHNLGICYLHLNQFDKAEKYLVKSSELHLLDKDTLMLIGAYTDIANLYYTQYKDQQAIPYFERAYHLSKKVNDFKLKSSVTLNMAVVEENRGNFPLALKYRKEYDKWKDSLNNQSEIWAVAQFEKKFAVNQKNKEITLLEAENKLKIAERNGLLYSFVLLLVLLVVGIYYYMQKVKNNKTILAQKAKLDELNATKDKLFSVVSHDLRSSVNALKKSNVTLLENFKTNNLDKLNKLLQNNVAIANSVYSLLDNLLQWTLLQTKQSYFKKESICLFQIVEQMSYNYKPLMLDKNIHFENKVSKSDLVYVDQESLKIILRNLLDNAIKFSNQEGTITVYSLDVESIHCNLIVKDTGIGISKINQKELLKETALLSKKRNEGVIGTGLGLQLCKSMIKKNGGKFLIESEEGKGTKMIVSLPKNNRHG
ncbi:ATP-binding protein [Snuella sedimenti]|uniref:histidine kinase n=1 Tax=Snuella sedimenti TaxID=2798802 RepID=A0A8J7IGK1_9FLAO|nr:ATP-binding protein [Snuella sedimenti]MBJ6369272.1 tetratricopeptide repeat-containing sensor histidine kinase [Snuella sedimenti]